MNEAADNQTNTVTAYVGLGSNLGDRAASLAAALRILGETPEIEVGQVSSLYESDPVGVTEQPEFLNAVAMLRTALPAHRLLAALLDIENFWGRTRTVRWGPRVLDLDLLLYGDAQIESADLVVPHPRLAEREFVLTPLAEIAPNLVLPGGRRTVQALASELSAKNSAGNGNIRRIGAVTDKIGLRRVAEPR